jgi:hypothetical protein
MMKRARLRLGPRFRPVKAILYYAMRLLPYASIRRSIAFMVAMWIDWLYPAPLPNNANNEDRETSEDHERIGSIVASLQQEGWGYLEPLLSPSQIADILAFLEKKKVIEGNRSFYLTQAPDDVRLAHYSLVDLLACPHILALINNAAVLRIAHAYLGCRPTISFLGLTCSFPSHDAGPKADAQYFHRDADDWRFLKLFVYLTDVDGQSGPHEFVSASHNSSGRYFLEPYTDEELERTYGRNSMVKITGPKGTSFMEDTWGIHKGHAPISRPRLLLQVQYSVLPVMTWDYIPVPVLRAQHLDRYTNRLLIA